MRNHTIEITSAPQTFNVFNYELEICICDRAGMGTFFL